MNSMTFKNALALTVLALLVTAPTFSYALSQGGTDGGGGNAIVCFNDESITKKIRENDGVIGEDMLKSIRSVETYDYAYAKLATLERKPKVVEIQDNEGFDQYARRIARRILTDAPEVFWHVENGLRLLKYNKALIRDTGVITISDMADVGVVDTSKCVVTTMAVQRLEEVNPLNLDGRLFQHPKHTRQSQAILILHEILYASARQYSGAQDSSGVRALIRMIATEGAGYSRAELTALISKKLKPQIARDQIKSYRMPEVQILEAAVQPHLGPLNNSFSAFQKFVWDLDKYSFWNQSAAERHFGINDYLCLADAETAAQIKSVVSQKYNFDNCGDDKPGLKVLKEHYPTFLNLWNDYYATYQIDVQKLDVEKLWAGGVQALMEKNKVRPEVQALLKKLYVKSIAESLPSYLAGNGGTWPELWNYLEQNMRNSNLELP